MVMPVLTAHPTEVRRKSTIDREMEVAHLLAERDRPSMTAAELDTNETALRRAVRTLWQTNLLRHTRLRVIDEVANGLSYYDYTFLAELPRFYADLEAELARADIVLAHGLPSFLRIGSWIGGDRDGNPFVTEEVLRAALRAQSSRALEHYLDELPWATPRRMPAAENCSLISRSSTARSSPMAPRSWRRDASSICAARRCLRLSPGGARFAPELRGARA
jgi:phosphoenolpyruvate carboxylase